MALLVSTSKANSDTATVTSDPIDTTGAKFIVAVLSGYIGITSFADNKGNTYTALTQRGNGSNAVGKLFYKIAPVVGSGHVFNTVTSYGSLSVLAFDDVVTTYDAESGVNAGTQPGSITPAEANELFISAITLPVAGAANAINSSFVIGASVGSASGIIGSGIAYKKQTTAAAENPTWSGSAPTGAVMMAAFKTAAPPTITTTTLPDGIIDASYSETLAATGGTGAITWSVTGGALPAGLSLNSSTGEISGTPSTVETASFTVTATDTAAATDTQALSIAITEAPSPFDPYDLLQVTPGLRIESIAWTGPVLRASFGSGYGAKALVGNASGLHRWSIHSGGIWWDALDSMTIGGVSRFEYYWEFFKEHTTGAWEIFVIQWRDRYWHVQFADVEMSVEKFKNATIYQGGFEVVQRRVQGAAYNTDGSINLMTTDLIAYWKLDETSGNAIDAHGSNDLTDTNTVGTAAGKVGNARDFEQSSSEYFTLADNAALSIADHGWTWTAWVYAESLIAYQAILSKSDETAVEYILYHLGGVFVLNASPDGTPEEAASVASSAVTTGTWYFVAAWYDATANTINIQVNNGAVASAAMATGGVNSAVAFELGHESNLGISWDGLIDEVAFWKRALSASERTFLYNGGDGVTYEDLV